MSESYVISLSLISEEEYDRGVNPFELFLGPCETYLDMFMYLNYRPEKTRAYYEILINNAGTHEIVFIGDYEHKLPKKMESAYIDIREVRTIRANIFIPEGTHLFEGNVLNPLFWERLTTCNLTDECEQNACGLHEPDEIRSKWKAGIEDGEERYAKGVLAQEVVYRPLDVGIEGLTGDAEMILNHRMIERIRIGEYEDDQAVDLTKEGRCVAVAICHVRDGGPSVMSEAIFVLLSDGRMFYIDKQYKNRSRIWDQAVSKDIQSIRSGRSWAEFDYTGIGRMIR